MSNMTAKEAHAILHPDTTAASIWEIKMDVSNEAAMKAVEEACVVACEALKKRIPKKPDLEGDGSWNWTDYEDGDQLQVKVDGKVYLVHSSNVTLIKER